MALEISYSPLFFENLEAILKFFDERNGSDNFSKLFLLLIYTLARQIQRKGCLRSNSNMMPGTVLRITRLFEIPIKKIFLCLSKIGQGIANY